MGDGDTDRNVWDAYNLLLSGPDVERLRKLCARYELFRMSVEIPGDIIECGVFKGTGLLLWLKLLKIHSDGSAKRVIGFDLFERGDLGAEGRDRAEIVEFFHESGYEGVTTQQIYDMVSAAGLDLSRCELVEGDVRETAPAFTASRPGFRISLLNIDMDLAAPTKAALESLWPRVSPGGIVILDEYGIDKWSESAAVDDFIGESGVELRSLTWARTPTAYIVKR